MSKTFIITAQNLEAIDRAIHVLRDRVKSRDSKTEEGREEDLVALIGLQSIFPQPVQDGPGMGAIPCLIAAAPEMLEALRRFVHGWESEEIVVGAYEDAGAAIAKAEGK